MNLAAGMQRMAAMDTMELKPWGALDFVLMFLMWTIMMIGMMLPRDAGDFEFRRAQSREARAWGGLRADRRICP